MRASHFNWSNYMATVKFKGNEVKTVGNFPKVGEKLNFEGLIKGNLEVVNLNQYGGKRKVLNIFPSIDTGVCAASVRQFNKLASDLNNTVVLNISMDLPFAQSRFCAAEGIANCESLSGFRSDFGQKLGVTLLESP